MNIARYLTANRDRSVQWKSWLGLSPMWVIASLLLDHSEFSKTHADERSFSDVATAVQIARQYLASEDDQVRETSLSRLETFSGKIDDVLRALRTRNYPAVKPQ